MTGPRAHEIIVCPAPRLGVIVVRCTCGNLRVPMRGNTRLLDIIDLAGTHIQETVPTFADVAGQGYVHGLDPSENDPRRNVLGSVEGPVTSKDDRP